MVVPSAKARKIIFIAGFALIIIGGVGLAVLHDFWLNLVTSIFTVSGTTMSFAQFALGFGTIKPQDSPAPASPTPTPAPVIPVSTEPTATLLAPNDQIPLGTTMLGIGRAPDNQHVIHDPQASGYHAIIHRQGQSYTITDLGSTNGTFVNGQRLTANVPCTLKPNDTIRIGTTSFTYQVKQASALAKTIPATEPHYQPGAAYGAAPEYAPPPPPAYDRVTPNYAQPAYGAAPNYAQYAPVYAPPPPQGSLYRPAWQQQKLYRRSGIALLLTGVCYLVQLFLLLSPKTPDFGQTFESFVILAYISLLFALRGLHARQEHKTGWLGTIGIVMLTAGAIINILIAGIYVANFVPGYSFSKIVSTTIVMLNYVNLVFLVSGDLLYGLCIIRANVYPRWTGVVLIIVGFLNFVALVPQAMLAISLLASVLLIAFLTRLGLILFKQPPQSQQQFVN